METLLEAQFDSRQSFYGKARVKTKDGIHTLVSYTTEVAQVNPSEKTFTVNGYYSPTTSRHINEFLLQHEVITTRLSKGDLESVICPSLIGGGWNEVG